MATTRRTSLSAASLRAVDEFIVTTPAGDVRFVDREDVPLAIRNRIPANIRATLNAIPDTRICKPKLEGEVIKQALKDHARQLDAGTLTRQQLFVQIEPELVLARRGDACVGELRGFNFLLTRPGQTQALGAWTLYNLQDLGVSRGVQLIESSVIPGIPNPGTPVWNELCFGIYRWFLFNTFVVDGTPHRVMQWTFPSADVGPQWDWAGTQNRIDWLAANGVTTTLHTNTPAQQRYGAVLIHTLVRT